MEIIKLNLIPSGVNPTCHCSQYDEGRVIRIELFDGLTPYTLQSGDTVTLNVRKPDNTIVTASVTATQGNKYVDLVTTEQICACVGYNLCDLTITNGSVVIGTLNFIMAVERDVLADGIPSQSVIEDLDELVSEAVEADLGDNYYNKTEVNDLLDDKADADEVNNKFKSIDGIQTIPFEMGNIDITLHGWSYSAATKRIRTPENYTIALKEGDVINAESGVRYYLGWQLSNDTYKRKGWLTGKTVIEESGDYVILASLDPEVTLESVDEVASKITVYAYTGTLAGEVNDCVYYEANINVKVGENILGQATLSTGWSESDGTYTHTSGNTNALVFDTTAVEGEIYLFEFDGVTPEETVSVGLGDTVYKMYVYTDNPHKIVPLKAYGDCKLYIEPLSNFSGSMSNLTLRKIQSSGTDVLLTVNAVYSKNHDNNYGFYNALIGKSTAQNAVGSTRTVAIGANALRDLQAGHRNIAIGTFAMSQMLGGEANVAIGADAMLAVQQAEGCVAIGKSALYNGNEISYNVAIGIFAGQGASGNSPVMCTLIGAFAGTQNRASYNTFVGANAGYNVTSGNQNTLVGANINGQATGNRNTCVGRSSGYPSGANDCIALGKGAVCTKTNQMMLGSTDVTEVVFCGNKKINFNNDGTVTWETLT